MSLTEIAVVVSSISGEPRHGRQVDEPSIIRVGFVGGVGITVVQTI